MASVQPEESCLSSYRKLLLKLSSDLTSNDLEKLKFAAVDFIPRGRTENIGSGIQFFDVLEQDLRIGPQNLGLLQDMFETIGRVDLAQKVQPFSTAAIKVEADGYRDDIVTDGGGDNIEQDPAIPGSNGASKGYRDDIVTDGGGDNTENDPAIPGSNGASRAEVAEVAAFRSVQLVRQPLLYSANDGGASAAFNAMSLSGNQGVPKIGQCLAVVDTSSFGNNGGIGPSSGLMGPAPAGLIGPAPAGLIGPAPAGLIGPAPAGLIGPAPAGLMGPAPAPSQAKNAGAQQRGAPGHSSGRVQHDSSIGPAPVRYVNFLTCEGYTVEIIGGKHFKTPEGEFVEMKSGTQYKIHVKNTRAYGCNLDVSIDGYDVGGWTVDGGDELSIERPVYEPKKFTFYRVKTAPKEAGIESGRSENGVVKCVFTPEAFLDVLVIISGSSQPLNVNMPPSATVGDLKGEVQRQLKASDDPDQVLVQGDKVLSNSARLRNILKAPTGNLRLIDVEIQITVEASSDKVFTVKIQPGKAKVHDLMKQIERELEVPIMDQKLYLGKARLSDEPRRGLPHELICNPQPTIVAIVPEYIHITVEDQNGESNAVKIDKEKSPRALMGELPLCSNLQENEEAMFHFNGKQLCPSKDEGSLTSLGVSSGSRLELKVKILFIEIFIEVSFLDHASPISVRCSPQDTFQDLVKKIKIKGKKREQERVTFVMEEKVFDPDQDKGPLQDYGVKHRSALQMRVVRPDCLGAQASQSADEVNIGVAHTLQKQGDSLDELEERQEKKSFLSALKEKFGWTQCPDKGVKEMKTASYSRAEKERRLQMERKMEGIMHHQREMRDEMPQGYSEMSMESEAGAPTRPGLRARPFSIGSSMSMESAALPPPYGLDGYSAVSVGSAARAPTNPTRRARPLSIGSSMSMESAALRKPSGMAEWALLSGRKGAPSPRNAGSSMSMESAARNDEIYDMSMESAAEQRTDRVTEPDPAWRAGGTTLQGYSTQQFTTADPMKVDHSRKVELVVRLVAREDEEDLVFPKDECKPLSTLYPPAVPE